jgi:hypothetical protein
LVGAMQSFGRSKKWKSCQIWSYLDQQSGGHECPAVLRLLLSVTRRGLEELRQRRIAHWTN